MLIKVQNRVYSLKSIKAGNEDHNDIYSTLCFYTGTSMYELSQVIIKKEPLNKKGYKTEFKKLNMINIYNTSDPELNNSMNEFSLTIGFYNQNEQVNFLYAIIEDLEFLK